MSNYVKAAEDALNGIVWVDDAQVVAGQQAKAYSDVERVEIVVAAYPALPCQITRRDQMDRIDRQEARR